MAKNIYVGNLPWNSTEEDVRSAFEAYGEVISVKLINDRETGRPRGFGFVEMEDQGALEAIENLDGFGLGWPQHQSQRSSSPPRASPLVGVDTYVDLRHNKPAPTYRGGLFPSQLTRGHY